MLLYINTVCDYITSWIRTIAETSKKHSLLCVITGGADSCLNAAMVLRATSYIPVCLVFMGFKSENEDVFEKWVVANFPPEHYKIIKPQHQPFSDPDLANIDARLSLIPAYVDVYSRANDALTFGGLTRSEYALVKFFKSRVDDPYDYFPLIDLYKSECVQLIDFIGMPKEILNAKSITENSFGFTFDELEWLDREDQQLSIVSASNFPNLAPHWALFNDRKKLLLTKVFQMKSANKNKTIPDQKQCLVRKSLPGAIS